MRKGILYKRNGQTTCFILNPFYVQNKDQAVLDNLIGKYIAVTFETSLYYFGYSAKVVDLTIHK